jgi:hypothetical protein
MATRGTGSLNSAEDARCEVARQLVRLASQVRSRVSRASPPRVDGQQDPYGSMGPGRAPKRIQLFAASFM